MAEKPKIFNSEEVGAILDGRKTQFREVIKVNIPEFAQKPFFDDKYLYFYYNLKPESISPPIKLPYQVGDRLWVKETWKCCPKSCHITKGKIQLMSICSAHQVFYKARMGIILPDTKFISSRFMPKWAVRIWLEVTKVREERLRNISKKDIFAEGTIVQPCENERICFIDLWDSTNTKRGYGWEKNPPVLVYDFKLLEKRE